MCLFRGGGGGRGTEGYPFPGPGGGWRAGVSPSQVQAGVGVGGTPQPEQHSLYLLRSGRYASCVHAGGLSSFKVYSCHDDTYSPFNKPGKFVICGKFCETTMYLIITALVRSMTGGYVFILSTIWGGTYLLGGGGVPTLRSGWGGVPTQVWGVPTFPGLGGGYLPSGWWGVPTQVWMMGGTYLGRGGTYLGRYTA